MAYRTDQMYERVERTDTVDPNGPCPDRDSDPRGYAAWMQARADNAWRGGAEAPPNRATHPREYAEFMQRKAGQAWKR